MSLHTPSLSSEKPLFTIDKATENSNLGEIASVINRSYQKVQHLKPGIERISIQDLEEIVRNPEKELYLCISPLQAICGTILLDRSKKAQAEIGLFAVRPDFQRRGIGPLLISSAEKNAFSSVEKISLKVIPLFQDNLIKMYRHFGYKETGEKVAVSLKEKEKYISSQYHNFVHFIVMEKQKQIRSSL